MDNKNEKRIEPISTSEAYHLLCSKKDTIKRGNINGNEYYKKTFAYCAEFVVLDNLTLIDEAKIYLKDLAFTEAESATILSTFPETVSDFKILLPTCVRFNDSLIQMVISKLQDISSDKNK